MADLSGEIWIADGSNNRVQRWLAAPEVEYALSYQSSFGTEGTAAGQLKHPAGLAIDAKRDIWVADWSNNRVEEFDGTGAFLKTFGWGVSNGEAKLEVCTASCRAGISGSGDGELKKPSAIAVDPEGNLWVADSNNCRVERFSPAGGFLSKFGGTCSKESGQFYYPEGLAVDSAGNVYVASSLTGLRSRVQEFNAKGEYLKLIAGEGTGNGQVTGPSGLAFDSSGNLWVADFYDKRVEEFNAAGEYVRQWKGSGGAAFEPFAIGVDAHGTVWVGDSEHNRVEGFNQYGDLLTSFGSEGSGEGQFKLGTPTGLVADLVGDVWLADSAGQRVEQWIPTEEEPPAPQAGDPDVEVNVSSGLVTSVEGEEAGTTTYSHTGDLLTAVHGSQGQTQYEYSGERLTKVTLPNGTWGEVKYDEFGRVKSVSVSVEGGKAKTTFFTYKDEPRRTTVSPEGAPITVYDIAPDGSVLKWWNKQEPPEIENLSGSLYANKETSAPVEPGDYELLVQAHSVEGIASIEIVANGNQLVDEKTCEQDYEKEGTECQTLEDPWVTETANWPPGILYLEVIVTDSVEGTETVPNTESTKFWVNIPYTPPPDPEADEPPKFSEVLRFREEFGLDLDLKGNELAIDERIFNLIGDWYNPHTPAGEVARATDERWGVPLRAVDAAELEYRERYIAQAATMIPQWAESHASSTYAGYYVDQRQGGIIHIGFNEKQTDLVSQFRAEVDLLAPSRVEPFETQPQFSLVFLRGLIGSVAQRIVSSPSIRQLVTQYGVDVEGNSVAVGATDASGVEAFLQGEFGTGAPITVNYDPAKPQRSNEIRLRSKDNRLFAGDALQVEEGEYLTECTTNFGASEQIGSKPTGEAIFAHFALTAGHCFQEGHEVKRRALSEGKKVTFRIGTVRRRAYEDLVSEFETDVEAIRLDAGWAPPRWIWLSNSVQQKVSGVSTVYPGQIVCYSGIYGGTHCGSVAQEPVVPGYGEGQPGWNVEVNWIETEEGDSGGPVWDVRTGKAVGNVTGSYWFTPLLPLANYPGAPGMLGAPNMGSLHIVTGG